MRMLLFSPCRLLWMESTVACWVCGSMVVVGAATKKGTSWWCAATAWQKVPILLAAREGQHVRVGVLGGGWGLGWGGNWVGWGGEGS